MKLYLLYTVTVSLAVPLLFLSAWFGVRWIWRKRVAKKKAATLNHLLDFDEADCYTQNDKV